MSEAIEAYKTELRRYKELNDRELDLMRRHKASKTSAHEANFIHRIEGMRQVLGLTPDEIRQIDNQVGFSRPHGTGTGR